MIDGEKLDNTLFFEVGVSPLKTIRERLQLSQEKLAHRLGVSTQTISRCERGDTELMLNVSQIKKLNQVVNEAGLSIDQLPDSMSSKWHE